jgi:hypothetical protein
MLELLLNKEFEFREQNSFRKRNALAPITSHNFYSHRSSVNYI